MTASSRELRTPQRGESESLCKEATIDTVVVGAGPAGLFAALHAGRSGTVLLVDGGDDLESRVAMLTADGTQQTAITSGFGGAGLFSDGKLCLSHRIGSTVAHRFPADEIDTRHGVIDEVVRGGIDAPLRGSNQAAVTELEAMAAGADLEYLHYPVRHVGSDQLPPMLERMREQLGPRVRRSMSTPCIDVRPRDGMPGWEVELGGARPQVVHATYVVLAPGKIGAAWLEQVGQRLQLEQQAPQTKLGFRLEGPRDFLDPVLKAANDPKIIWKAGEGAEVRTHCVCYGGDVVSAAYRDLALVGGHSASDHASDRSNTALLATAGSALSLSPKDAYDLAARINARHRRGIVGQGLGDFLTGNTTSGSLRTVAIGFIPSLPDAAPGNLAEEFPAPIVDLLRQFVLRLSAICPQVSCPGNLIYGPAIERWAYRFVVSDDMEAAPGLFLVGDGPGLTGGIVAAAETGWRAGEVIAHRLGT
jgi:uncharacterized protein